MATVKVTPRFMSDISNKIEKMRAKELAAAGVSPSNPTHLFSPKTIEKFIWGEHHHIADMMPQDWLHTRSAAGIGFWLSDMDGARHLCTVNTDGPIRFRPNMSFYETITASEDGIESVEHAEDKAVLFDLYAQAKMKDEITNKWKAIEKDVKSVFSAFPTVNRALKAVPSLRMYLSAEDIERIERKAEPRKDAVVELGVDVGNLTAAAVAHTLGV